MNIITAKANINTDVWEITKDELDSNTIQLEFFAESIVDGENSYIEFNGFKYGFFLRDQSGAVVQYGSYPKVGERIISTDSILTSIKLETEIDESYSLHIWAEDAGKFYDSTVELVIPTSVRPYDPNGEFLSWSWDSALKEWIPPVEKPQDPSDGSGFYKWNESETNWIFKEIIPIIE